MLRCEFRRPRTQRVFARSHRVYREGVPVAPSLQTQHHSGSRTNAWNPFRIRRRPNPYPVYRIDGRARSHQIGMPANSIPENSERWGLIAGNGDFPFLVLEGARSRGIEMAVIAIREEASPAIEQSATRVHWVSLGELSRTIELLHQEGVKHAVMAGQVKHNKIFSSIRPDWRLAKLLLTLSTKNTDSLIGAVARVLEDEGIELVDSTKFLGPLLPEA